MFTPPASPFPDKKSFVHEASPKARIGRKLKWTAVIGPIIFVLVTLSVRYITHPAFFHILVDPSPENWNWSPHERHLTIRDSSPVPTVPVSADVPSPFPQPFDSNMQQNFSSASCYNFFSNMTNTVPFRSCRPLSLLLQTSSELVDAQKNLTLLNSIIWGTCQTKLNNQQCSANMAWFANTLQSACAQELTDNNTNVVNTLMGLHAFDLMYTVGCLSDPSTNTYCYLNAVHNSNPSDLYLYQLPLGLALPSSSTPTCSPCAKSVLSAYVSALENTTTVSQLPSLAANYPDAQQITTKTCGASYAKALASGAFPLAAMGIVVLVASLTTSLFIELWCL